MSLSSPIILFKMRATDEQVQILTLSSAKESFNFFHFKLFSRLPSTALRKKLPPDSAVGYPMHKTIVIWISEAYKVDRSPSVLELPQIKRIQTQSSQISLTIIHK